MSSVRRVALVAAVVTAVVTACVLLGGDARAQDSSERQVYLRVGKYGPADKHHDQHRYPGYHRKFPDPVLCTL